MAFIAICLPQVALADPAASRSGRAGRDQVRAPGQKGKVKPRKVGRIRRGFRAVKKRLRIPPKVKRKIRRGVKIAKGYGTLAADKIQASLPRRLSKGFAKARMFAPTSLGGFAGHKFSQDKLFLGSFGVAYPVATHLQIPAFVYLGMDPVTAVVAHEVIEVPLSLGILAWRQHHIREDRSQSFGGTLKKLGKDYRDYAKKQQSNSRRFIKNYKRLRHQNRLRQMSGELGQAAQAAAAQ